MGGGNWRLFMRRDQRRHGARIGHPLDLPNLARYVLSSPETDFQRTHVHPIKAIQMEICTSTEPNRPRSHRYIPGPRARSRQNPPPDLPHVGRPG